MRQHDAWRPGQGFDGPAESLYERFLWRLFNGDYTLYERYQPYFSDKAKIGEALSAVNRPVLILIDEVMDYMGHPGRVIKGVPWDIPIVGFGAHTVNILRLWESRASEFFDWDVFNHGGYIDSQKEKAEAETISKVLYPNDETEAGKELRLVQQYFFCACS